MLEVRVQAITNSWDQKRGPNGLGKKGVVSKKSPSQDQRRFILGTPGEENERVRGGKRSKRKERGKNPVPDSSPITHLFKQ